ncbi:radical SAM/SPASM domain-containing protein [Anaerosalibacter massiliensis]|uniref:Radical SAM/SPASM domain-containing protein n=1 Tax=Anaerosalibacter massiliensis TaxID=1347392 RepID=A0A9X2MFM1_9FIRM|nr:radical SAM/SPASM domain-containing protein [Anaerosalibacter massiliensis]MCR2044122.1 radical SAM/SPASM domain-containing protein [Anaerosalibacter massiliensis]
MNYAINQSIVYREKNNNVFILSEENSIIIDGVGVDIWNYVIKGYSKEKIIKLIAKKYKDVERSIIEIDVEKTLNKLEKNNIIKQRNINQPILSHFYDKIDFLYKVVLELTYNCNNKCQYCYNGEYKENDLLSTEKIKEIIDESYKLGAMHLSITGGEPLLRNDLLEILRYGNEKKFYITLQTNGTLLTDDIARSLSNIRPINVAITLHSHDYRIHDEFTRRKGSYTEAINGIKLLKKYNIPVTIRYVVTKKNFDGIDDYDKLAKELGVHVNRSPLLYPTTDGSLEPLKLRLTEKQIEYLVQYKNYKPQKDPCGAGKTKIIVSPEGKVYPCTFYHKELGDICQYTIKQILNNNKTKNIQKMFEQPSYCRECDKEDNCPRCPVISYYEKNNFKDINPFDCMIANVCKKEMINE